MIQAVDSILSFDSFLLSTYSRGKEQNVSILQNDIAEENVDKFEPAPKINGVNHGIIPDGGTDSPKILAMAPSPKITIKGKEHNAVIVVNIKENLLFKYDKEGNVERAYSCATGSKFSPTHPKVAIVTHKETYPYRYAPKNSKRRRTPAAFGKFCICMNKIDPKTGEQTPTGEFIHGTNVPSSVGKKVSHGCMRMHKSDIEYLKDQVVRGDIVIVLSGD